MKTKHRMPKREARLLYFLGLPIVRRYSNRNGKRRVRYFYPTSMRDAISLYDVSGFHAMHGIEFLVRTLGSNPDLGVEKIKWIDEQESKGLLKFK